MANYKKKQLNARERKALIRKLGKVSASARAKSMYRMRYGLDDGGIISTYKDIGKHFNVTGEAVRLVVTVIHKLINEK